MPFSERAGRLRGLLDLATGCYPSFLFGGPVGRQLPVFHLHEVTPAVLEPQLRYLADNGYRTVSADAVAAFATRGVSPGPRAVALTFDDAWSSLWTVAFPLLRRYGMTAITFAIPSRIADAPSTRPTLDDGVSDAGSEDASDTPFVTWPELRALHDSGVIEVQSHSYSHACVFCSDRPVGFITPAFAREPLLALPLTSVPGARPDFLSRARLGAPLYVRRSRLSDARRFLVNPEAATRATAHVAAHGGPDFFARPEWHAELEGVMPAVHGRFESDAEQRRAVEEELERSRSELNERLGSSSVRHLALPWGVLGHVTREALRRGGYESAFAECLFRPHTVRPGHDRFSLGRLNVKFLQCLPGRERRSFLSMARG